MNTFEQSASPSKKAVLSSILCDSIVTHDISEEFTLPDYVPEVRKVLFTRAQVLPESKYISDTGSGAGVDFGGTVTYSVIYTDDEGKLCSTPLSSNYEASSVLKERAQTIFIDTCADNVTTRVNAPRKLTVKTRLKSRIFAIGDNEIVESIAQKSSADELFIERLCVGTKTVSVASASLQGIKMSEKFDTGSKKSLRPILCDAFVCLKDVKAVNGCVSVRGEATVKCLCESEGELLPLTRTMPVYEELECDGSSVGDMARANARCVSLSISSEETEDGAELFFDMSCEIESEVYRNAENTLTSDCYSTKCEMDTSYRDVELYSLIRGFNGSFSLNEAIKRKSKDNIEIIDTLLDPVYEKTDFKGSLATVSGRLCASVIGRMKKDEADEGEYIAESYEIPFRYDFDMGAACENPVARVNVSASIVSAKYSDDKLRISAEMYPSIAVIDKGSVKILDTATLKKDKEFKTNASCVRVFFPKDGDILWEVAKKYHTTQKKIAEQNTLSGYSLDGVKSIIV